MKCRQRWRRWLVRQRDRWLDEQRETARRLSLAFCCSFHRDAPALFNSLAARQNFKADGLIGQFAGALFFYKTESVTGYY